MGIKLTKNDNSKVALKSTYLQADTEEIYNNGYKKGYADGELVSYDKGHSDGKKADLDELWDSIQRKGNRTDYYAAFVRWQKEKFYPKYDIKGYDLRYLFYYFGEYGETMDLVERLAECGVIIDFSSTTSMANMFSNSRISHVGEIDTSKASSLSGLFDSCYYLTTIDKLILKTDGNQSFSTTTFQNTRELVNITVEGVIGQKNFNVAAAVKLTHDSLMSIINALQDKTTDTSVTTWLVTLGSTNLNKLTEEEKLLITEKGWTYK